MITLEEKKKNRWLMLKKFYEIANGQSNRYIINMWDVGKELGWDRETIHATYDYLQGERLLKAMTLGGGATITHEGVKEVEEAEKYPERPTLHFPSMIMNISGDFVQGDRVNRKEVIRGDSYTTGQAGAIGPQAHAQDMTFNQIWNQSSNGIDVSLLAKELFLLRQALTKEASEAEHYADIGTIASAEIEAKKANGPKALEYLSKAGKWTLDVASKIGVNVVSAAIKESLGIK